MLPAPEVASLQERPSQREKQKQRTRAALVDAARSLVRSGDEVTMAAIARAAGVSEATAYRHFPDLLTALVEGLEGVWPDVWEALPDLAGTADPVERIGMVTAFLAENVLRIQGAVRAMIALTIARPGETVDARPAHRLALIDIALTKLVGLSAHQLAELKRRLVVVVSAEALFTLLDLQHLDPDVAVSDLAATARVLVQAALRDVEPAAVPQSLEGPSRAGHKARS